MGVLICFGELCWLFCVNPVPLLKAVLGVRIWGWGWGRGGTILTSVDNSVVKELKLELSFILTLCTGHYFSCSAHRNMKADKTKPHSQGHTANKTQWDLRSDN